MDTVVKLVQPDDYSPEDGARFEIHFTKNRGFFGSRATAFEARLDTTGWIRTPLKATQEMTLMQAMRAEGKSMEAIGLAVGCDKSTVSRRLRAAPS
jgi:putative DNA primase/helicase